MKKYNNVSHFLVLLCILICIEPTKAGFWKVQDKEDAASFLRKEEVGQLDGSNPVVAPFNRQETESIVTQAKNGIAPVKFPRQNDLKVGSSRILRPPAEPPCACDNDSSPVASSWKCGSYLFYCPGALICEQSLNSNPFPILLTEEECSKMNDLKINEICDIEREVYSPARELSHKVCYVDGILSKFDGKCEPCRIVTAFPTPSPSPKPSPAPSPKPPPAPSPEPSSAPSLEPSLAPSQAPSPAPSPEPSTAPSLEPSLAPSQAPSPAPSPEPSSAPSLEPSLAPSQAPSPAPSPEPSQAPSPEPSPEPSSAPTACCEDPNTWKCGLYVYYCESLTKICKQSIKAGVTLVPLSDEQCEEMKTVDIGDKCIYNSEGDSANPANPPRDLSHRVCDVDGSFGIKEDEDSCDLCELVPIPETPAPVPVPAPVPAPTKAPRPTNPTRPPK
ncbi:allergen V5/Tpx-1-like protein [Nitzschia inconspicua]|uniref:Allergen V5/Tpx-1-like protein n=1 Tax=Nitzschia inconspicua TaxID=303405 RepID=A0A9K3PBV5_9STRA|nr:allergen V5/Tpx-1-like protein [Nitzschia inconspicua]